MKTYVKSIRWKQTNVWPNAHDEHDKEDHSPCIDCVDHCNGVECVKLKKWLHGKDEVVIEQDVFHDSLIITRVIFRAVVWLAFFVLLGIVSYQWIGLRKYMVEHPMLEQSNSGMK